MDANPANSRAQEKSLAHTAPQTCERPCQEFAVSLGNEPTLDCCSIHREFGHATPAAYDAAPSHGGRAIWGGARFDSPSAVTVRSGAGTGAGSAATTAAAEPAASFLATADARGSHTLLTNNVLAVWAP